MPTLKSNFRDGDLVRVVCIVAPFVPLGAGTRGEIPRREMGPRDVCRVPIAA